MTNDEVEKALSQCRKDVRDCFLHVAVDEKGLDAFKDKFKKDFTDVIVGNPGKWPGDIPRVTTLARAIGCFAEFLTIARKKNTAGFDELESAYKILKPHCRDDNSSLRVLREYCSGYNP